MSALDDPKKPGGLQSSGLEGGHVEGASGLESGALDAPTQTAQAYRTAGQQRGFEKQQAAREAAEQRKAEERAYGDDLSGERGLSGLVGAIRQIALEVCQRAIAQIRISGDGHAIEAKGDGDRWQILWKRPLESAATAITRSGSSASHPFQVLDASMTGQMKVKGYVDSYIFGGTDLTTPLTLGGTGLDTAANVAEDDVCYLEFTLDDAVTITAQEFKVGAQWSGYPAMFHLDTTDPDNPFVDKIRLLIAEVVATSDTRDGTTISDGTDSLKIIQRWRNNIFLQPCAAEGATAYLPIPFA